MSKESILKTVQDQYGAVARNGLLNESGAVRSVAQAFGYAQAGSGECCSSTPNVCCSTTESSHAATSMHGGLAQVLRQFDANT